MRFFSVRSLVAGLMLVGGGAVAQEDICGGLGAKGHWIGGDEASSDISVAEAAFDKMTVVPLNVGHIALFNVSEQAVVRMEAVGQGSGDPVIELKNTDGISILEDDDSGGGGAARAETVLEAGTYCLSTRAFDGGVIMAQIRVGREEHEPLTSGVDVTAEGGEELTACTADSDAMWLVEGGLERMLDEGISVSNAAQNVPYYKFSLGAATQLSLTASGEDTDPVLYLYDGNGGLIAENDDANGLNSRIDMAEALPAGDYCVGIRDISDGARDITLSVFAYDEEAILIATYDVAEASPPLDGSHPVEDLGVLGSRLRVDLRIGTKAAWYSFDVEEASLVLIEGISVGGTDPVLTLFDDVGRMLQQNDDSGGSTDAMVASKVYPGKYVFAVTQPGGLSSTPGSIRLVLERYLPVK